MTGKKNESSTIKLLLNYDYIFLSSKHTIVSFKNLLEKYSNFKIKLLSSGYPRLDYLQKNLKKKSKEFCIVIALANYKAYPDYTIVKSLPGIVELILKKFNYHISLRPHPANREHFKKDRFKKIFDIIDNNKRVKLDLSDNYIETYSKSVLMITDISGTAYTYSFLMNKPVIFFSNNEKLISKSHKNLNHFRDRKQIGKISNKISNLNSDIKYILRNSKSIKLKIKKLRSQRLDYHGKTKKRFASLINQVINLD